MTDSISLGRKRRLIVGMILLVIAVVVIVGGGLLVSSRHKAQVVNRENFTAVISDFLNQRGYVCLAKYDWPITVTAEDSQAHSRDANQMPVLEALGLVAGRDITISHSQTDGSSKTVTVREYQLTAEGRKYWQQIPVVVTTATQHTTYSGDLCAARLSLDRVIGWERPMTLDGRVVTSVLFTYRIQPEPWATTSRVRQVFPAVSRAIEGAGTMQLREGVHLTSSGWVVDEMVSP